MHDSLPQRYMHIEMFLSGTSVATLQLQKMQILKNKINHIVNKVDSCAHKNMNICNALWFSH